MLFTEMIELVKMELLLIRRVEFPLRMNEGSS